MTTWSIVGVFLSGVLVVVGGGLLCSCVGGERTTGSVDLRDVVARRAAVAAAEIRSAVEETTGCPRVRVVRIHVSDGFPDEGVVYVKLNVCGVPLLRRLAPESARSRIRGDR